LKGGKASIEGKLRHPALVKDASGKANVSNGSMKEDLILRKGGIGPARRGTRR